jgi:aspartate aminotransferase-like enzyme
MVKLMTPGPVEICGDVLAEMNRSMIHHRGEEFRSIVRAIVNLLQEASKTSRHIALLNGTGTLATEAMIYSFLEPGEKVVAVSHGEFGERLVETALRRGLKIYEIRHRPGEPIDIDTLKKYLDIYRPSSILFVLNETSTGHRLSDIYRASKIARKYGLKILVDAVSAFGGEVINIDEWGIDALASCSHKALASPPGVSFVIFNTDMLNAAVRISRSSSPPPRYLDIYLHYNSIVKGSSTPYTAVVPVFRALKRSLENIIYGFGIDRWISIHSYRSSMLYRSLNNSAIKPLIEVPEYRTNTLAVFKIVNGENPRKIVEYAEKAGYIISEGMGEYKKNTIRLGVMGCIDIEDINMVVEAILRSIG